jgi:hypothetical protein
VIDKNEPNFSGLVGNTRRFSRDDFVTNLGGIVEDVAAMLASDVAQGALREARDYIEAKAREKLPNDMPQLTQLSFGTLANAPELLEGKVAAVDGTPVLPLQKYSAGQAICVGIGSRSYTRRLDDVLHGYTSKVLMSDLKRGDTEDVRRFLRRVQEGVQGISQTAYMRYFEAQHALDVMEPYIFCDGTLVYEWLINQDIGRELYKRLLSTKKAIGIIKSTKDSVYMSWFGRALEPGEIFIYETLFEHITDIERIRQRGRGEMAPQWQNDVGFVEQSHKVYRGVFKPAQKHFGFECHLDHLEPMLRIMAADCQMNQPGHEIPFLLNEVDREIRRFFKTDLVQMRIAHRLSQNSENLFLEESNERDFR